MLMYNFRKKYEFPRRSLGEKFGQYVTNLLLLFCCKSSSNRGNAQKWWAVRNMYVTGTNCTNLTENGF